MEFLTSLARPDELDSESVGQKALNLALASAAGINVPHAVSISVEVYREFVRSTRLTAAINLELGRRDSESMRWEEMWDASLRIRNSFMKASWPQEIKAAIRSELENVFNDHPVAVRSSAPDEDSNQTSFAGLHDSYLNVCGADSIMDKIKLVWASLWSDAAILYRRDLGLEVEHSAMSVIIQRLVTGDCSGVAFRQSPDNPERSVIEAVNGLNEGLVDGSIEPTRWFLDHDTGAILDKHDSKESKFVALNGANGTEIMNLPEDKMGMSPLRDEQVVDVYNLCVTASDTFGAPQDVEWTILDGDIYLLQSRDITASAEKGKDSRAWYLTLRRSYENLQDLRVRIEEEVLPGMEAAAVELESMDLASMDDESLKKTAETRQDVYDEWNRVYYADCIPMAHGMRLFGQFYNDMLMPDDPHEFIIVLSVGQDLLGVKRNLTMGEFYTQFSSDPELWKSLQRMGADALSDGDRESLVAFTKEFSSSFVNMTEDETLRGVLSLILKLDKPSNSNDSKLRAQSSEENFLKSVPDGQREFAGDLLDLGRASYGLRDNDNIYLGRIEKCVTSAINELASRGIAAGEERDDEAVKQQLEKRDSAVAPRQLVGQPAGPGIATGIVHLVRDRQDLFTMPENAVMVCDAIDPCMTIAVPLASAIVERRGGMLIHGAIIAREYGIPCVTGIDRATELIKNGSRVSVDGYLGILTLLDDQAHPDRG